MHFLFVYLCEVADDVCYQGSIGNNFVVIFIIIGIRLRTSNPLKYHPRWEPLNGIGLIECCVSTIKQEACCHKSQKSGKVLSINFLQQTNDNQTKPINCPTPKKLPKQIIIQIPNRCWLCLQSTKVTIHQKYSQPN